MNHDEMDAMSMIEYRARVERAASIKDGEAIYNGTTEHAQIVIEALFRSATSCVRILSHALNHGVYNHPRTLDAAEEFLARNPNASLEILVERNPHECREGSEFLSRFGKDKRVKQLLVPTDVQNLYRFHFAVADRESYRFEDDKTRHAAIASFGSPKGASNLDKIFQSLWRVGKPFVREQITA